MGDQNMTEDGGSASPPPSCTPKRRRGLLHRAFWWLVAMGCGAVVIWVFDHAMLATSTPRFCVTCHEIEPAFESWIMSPHASNAHGVVAECMDCHLPHPSRRFAFYVQKAHHGTKDILAHWKIGRSERTYDRERCRLAARRGIPNSRCQRCHQDLITAPGMTRGAMLAHRATLYPRKGYEKSCMECHPDVGHRPATLYAKAH